MKKLIFTISILVSCGLISGCSQSEIDNASSIIEDLSDFDLETPGVSVVKNGSLNECSHTTLGEMANAYMSNPNWSDFIADSGGTVVELSGGITYSGMEVTALIQFDVYGTAFEASYLGFNGVDQNQFMLNTLLTKMCDAPY
jgi:hypothetical protein